MDQLWEMVATAGGIAPAERRVVVDEPVDLPDGEPDRWRHGYRLRGVMTDCRGIDDTAAPGALRPGTLRLRDADGPLRPGTDYLVDEHWAALTRKRPLREPVAEYEYSLLRVDVLLADGRLLRGHSHLSNPQPPGIPDDSKPLATIFVPYAGDDPLLIPWTDVARTPLSAPQLDRLPAVRKAIAEGRPVRITCWGDSVTAGGSASSERTAYPSQLQDLLRTAGIAAELRTVAIGGSESPEWLSDGAAPNGADWRNVAATKPDLITLEFVNDAELDPSRWPSLYDEIHTRCRATGADLLLLEPHFTRPDWMHLDRIDAPDPRPYVAFLRAFAARESVAIAAVSDRWHRLYAEGVAYPTLLRNGINHPDDRGHRIYAEEAAAVLGVRPG
ncbi:GDSL-type esterase/lipase family protein [Kribbella sp. NPDC059898]|uniref:SGNH/GDSL hydrolase family protein n=1 Tax=Kribbella sp. NPDC059898 TaxID=3346995 RepID=UPI0036497C21